MWMNEERQGERYALDQKGEQTGPWPVSYSLGTKNGFYIFKG